MRGDDDIERNYLTYKQPEEKNALADLLPYRSFIEESNVFINNNSYGFMLETIPFSGADESTSKILAGLITQGFPEETVIQISCWASPNIDTRLKHWSLMRTKAGPLFQRLTDNRRHYLGTANQRSLLDSSSYLIRDYRCFVTVSLPGSPSALDIKTMESLQRSLLTSLQTMRGFARVLKPHEFLPLLSEWVNPCLESSEHELAWNERDPLNVQIPSPKTQFSTSPSKLSFNDDELSLICLSARKIPEYWAQWQMNDLIGDMYNDQLSMPCPFLSVLTLIISDQDKERTRAAVKFSRATKQNLEGASRFMPVVQKQEQDWRWTQQALSSGDKLVKAHYQIVLYSRTEQLESAESAALALYESRGWKVVKEKYVQLQSWLAALPFIPSEGLIHDMIKMGRYKTLLSSNCANLSPLQGEWKGMSTPRILLTGRRGQPLFWDPFDNSEGNYNAAIVGKSGSGKSVFLQELCLALLGSGARVFVIDKGRSFMRLAKFLGGTFLEFNRKSNICLNPFSHIIDTNPESFQESLKLLKPLIQIMAKPSEGTNDWENAVIEQAIHSVWQDMGHKSTITQIAKWLAAQKDSRAHDLAQSLYPYTREGGYGHFFEGESNVDLSNDFVVLELEELQGLADLQSVVMLVLMFQISQAMYLGGRKRHIACVIDEAWDLMGHSEQAAQFIEKGYRQARKYSSSFMTGTQGINDYHKTPAALSAFENSDWLVMLSQKPESIEALKQSGRLAMSSEMEKMLKSLHTRQDVYSESMIYGPQGYAVGRLFLDPFSLALYTSKGEDFAKIQTYMEQGLSVEAAIERFLQSKSSLAVQ